jgi:hypothetical protein
MWKDPIVEEIHAVREEIARKFDFDLKRIFAYLREQQDLHPERVIGKEEFERRRMAASVEDRSHADVT